MTAFKKALPKLFFLLLILGSMQTAWSQKKVLSEKSWLIDHEFSKESETNKTLSSIVDLTILGKYDEAKKLISKKKKSAKGKDLAAYLLYEGNIAYNESHYQKSIELADSTIQLINDKSNRLVLRAMNNKSKAYSAFNDYPLARSILDTVILISNEMGDKFNLGSAIFYYGVLQTEIGDNQSALRYLQRSIKIRKEIGDDLGLASSYSFIGLSYAGIDNYTLAIDYIQKSITIRQACGDKRGLANSYLTMYKVYNDLGEVNKAMEMELKSLKLCQELSDQQCISGRYTNLGQLYQKKGNYTEALKYHLKALALSKRLKIKNRIGLVHENMGKVYALMGQNEIALAHLDSSLTLRREIGERDGEASTLLAFADVYLMQGEYKKSIQRVEDAMILLKKVQSSFMKKEAHRILSANYSALKLTDKAFYHYQQFVKLKDSLFNAEQSKQVVRQELEFAFAQKEEKQKKEQERIKQINLEKSKRQQTITIGILSVAIILGLMLVFSIRQFILKNRSKLALEKSNELLNFQNTQLEENKRIIETQHLEITDSIRYAQKIQEAVLPEKASLAECFESSFVIFHPKDVISGDFYWMHKDKNQLILVTADCTGHGVPGGFMSMLGISLLNDLIIEAGLSSPAAILTKLREKVISSLKQKGDTGEQKDGMDMTICKIDLKATQLTYATANHVVFLIRDGQLMELRGDKHPVGIYGEELLPFNDHLIELQKGDQLYTFSDGYPDQFGGPKEKKFKYSQLKEVLLSHCTKPMEEQGKLIDQAFYTWKGDCEQTDDVTLIGFTI